MNYIFHRINPDPWRNPAQLWNLLRLEKSATKRFNFRSIYFWIQIFYRFIRSHASFSHETNSIVCFSCSIRYAIRNSLYKNLRGKLLSKCNNLLPQTCRQPRTVSTLYYRVGRNEVKTNIYLFQTFDWRRCSVKISIYLFSIYYGLSMQQFTCNSIRCGDPMTQQNRFRWLVRCCTRRRFTSNTFRHRNPISASGWAKNVHTKSVAPKAIIVCFHIAWCNNLFIRFLL